MPMNDSKNVVRTGSFCAKNNERRAIRLSERECQLVRYVVLGLTNAGIAQRLGIAPSTVRTYFERLYRKLDVHSRTEMLMRCLELGLIDLPQRKLQAGVHQSRAGDSRPPGGGGGASGV